MPAMGRPKVPVDRLDKSNSLLISLLAGNFPPPEKLSCCGRKNSPAPLFSADRRVADRKAAVHGYRRCAIIRGELCMIANEAIDCTNSPRGARSL